MYRRAVLLGLVALAACKPAAPDPQLVAQWLHAPLALLPGERLDPPVAARVTAYAAIALYEGYAADPRSNLRSLAGQLNGLWSVPMVERGRPVDGATVAAEAERAVLDSLLGAASAATRHAIDSLADAQVRGRRRARVGDDLRDRSVRHGRALGNAILAWASTDGFLATRGRAWRVPSAESRWVTAAPVAPMEPFWGNLRPFALRNGDECAPPPAPAYSQRPGSEFWKMGKELYDSARAPTDTQRAIALFWADDTLSTGTPDVHWHGLIRQMIALRRLSADQAVETWMLTSVAIADAFIGCWKEQYRSMVVRPTTFVRRALDGKWNALVPTPPFPAHPSSHATLSGAAAEVLIKLLGDSTGFMDSSQVASRATARSFRTFSEALEEAALSRVYGGVDYVLAVVNGTAQGRCIGQRVVGRLRTRQEVR